MERTPEVTVGFGFDAIDELILVQWNYVPSM